MTEVFDVPQGITGELREKLAEYKPQETSDEFIAHPIGTVGYDIMMALCDSIDAVHANLERENAELRDRLAVLDNRSESARIGEATVTITPTLDWTGVARELRAIADTLEG